MRRLTIGINTEAVENNARIIKKIIGKAEIIAIVKADGYGHGAVEIAKAASRAGVTHFGVATAEEAFALRDAGIDGGILVLGACYDYCAEECVRQDIAQTVFSLEAAETISKAAQKQLKTAEIHIKVDTGMARLGFHMADAARAASVLSLPNINVSGVFSHFAESDACDKAFSLSQKHKFDLFCGVFERAGFSGKKHMANSAAILNLGADGVFYDYVRPGILLYGISPSSAIDISSLGFSPVMSVTSGIIDIRRLGENETVGYNRTFFASRDTIVATVPIGYADGFPRALSNSGKAVINGCVVPVIGNVCMDLTMFDVTNVVGGVKIGDAVTIIGKNGGSQGDSNFAHEAKFSLCLDEITMADFAKQSGASAYESVCLIGSCARGERIYYKD
ncbi:alanine racemase [Clostridia bacterium]|nr:alanine racemase [Clostridia bacterium]